MNLKPKGSKLTAGVSVMASKDMGVACIIISGSKISK